MNDSVRILPIVKVYLSGMLEYIYLYTLYTLVDDTSRHFYFIITKNTNNLSLVNIGFIYGGKRNKPLENLSYLSFPFTVCVCGTCQYTLGRNDIDVGQLVCVLI